MVFNLNDCKLEYIVAPTYGKVVEIRRCSVTIYISVDDDHNVFAPIDGKITKMETFEGEITRYLKIFKSYEKKKGRVKIFINGCLSISFWLEVGEGYVTDRVRLDRFEGDFVSRGENIGEIILGSLSEIHLPESSLINVEEGDYLIGGETIIAFWNNYFP